MELQFEAAKGAVEQVLSVRSPLMMRVLLPGALTTAVLYPSVAWILGLFPGTQEQSWQRLLVFAGMVLALGELISVLADEIYKIYEGRILWPQRLLQWGMARQERRLQKFQRRAERAREENDNQSYDEAWYQLRLYPLNERSEPEVQRPTLLGNILAGYEQYPDNRYGMDSVFYWPRIWLQIEKEKKEEIDGQWCVADGLLILSAASMAGGALWIVEAAIFLVYTFPIPLKLPFWAALAGLAWWIAGYSFYRLSLPHHRANGELFKSIFDLYRAKIWDLTSLMPQERRAWDAAWSYLQYLKVVCPNCDRMNAVSSENCAVCGFDLRPLIRNIADSGRLSTQP